MAGPPSITERDGEERERERKEREKGFEALCNKRRVEVTGAG
jgi:hypothetical protein